MERRTFILGLGGTAIGGSALLGSGAFSRVESQRDVTIEVAEDPDAYLSLDVVEGSANSENYVDIDENGHIEIEIDESPNGGEGVNSNSITFFDDLLQITNQGSEDAAVWFPEELLGKDSDGAGAFYVGEAAGSGSHDLQAVHGSDNALRLPLGERQVVGLAVDLGSDTLDDIDGFDDVDTVEATAADAGIDETVQITADVGVESAVPEGPEPAVVAETDADTLIPVLEFEDEPSQDQFEALEDNDLTDPFTLAVRDPDRAGDDSTDYAVTAFYDEFGESPNDRLPGPTTPLSYDENGTASVTIGSSGTDADVTTWIAPGSLSDDATLVNNIEVPEGAEYVAVQTEASTSQNVAGREVSGSGEFTEVDTV